MTLDFQKMPDQLVPAVVQDAATGQVLMLGYFNAEAWQRTQAEGRVTFFSRSKQRLWTKGETSGNYLQVVSLHVDCDQDTVLVMARPDGPTCHRGTTSCFEALPGEASEQAALPTPAIALLAELDQLILHRQQHPETEPGSYTVRLFEKGLARIAQKVGGGGRRNGYRRHGWQPGRPTRRSCRPALPSTCAAACFGFLLRGDASCAASAPPNY
jgi:phosphoribosyl-ATP pyrophosphohydrolase/phosphoribosyl-AMP cyclohydrolase